MLCSACRVVASRTPRRPYVERGNGFGNDHPEWKRTANAKPLAYYEQKMAAQNKLLQRKGHTQMTVEELVAARLCTPTPHRPTQTYGATDPPSHRLLCARHVADTGPMYEKYNGVLRCFSAPLERGKASPEPFLQARAGRLGLGTWAVVDKENGRIAWMWHNKYPTSLHAINSAVLKLSKLSAVATVYRGFTDAVLPKSFFKPNEDGVCGGVEYGFTSTSTVRAPQRPNLLLPT